MSKVSGYLDQELPERERLAVEQHLSGCSECASYYLDIRKLRASMRALPARKPPENLRVSLLVLASRERARRKSRETVHAVWQTWKDHASLWISNLMRPLALPAAGGLCSAVLLFGLLVPMIAPRVNSAIADVPTGLYRGASLKSIPFGISSDEIVLELTVDGEGRMVDYSVYAGHNWLSDPETRRSIEHSLLFTRFDPATKFGRATYAKVRISFHRSSIDVKG